MKERSMSQHTPQIGAIIHIKKGGRYTLHDPIAFRRSDGTVSATIYHIKGQRCYLDFGGGQKGDTRLDAIEIQRDTGNPYSLSHSVKMCGDFCHLCACVTNPSTRQHQDTIQDAIREEETP